MADTARILERGYRPYEGERGNVGAAIRTAAKHAMQRSLGLKRTVWQKVLPVVSIAMAYIPAIVFVGLAALLDDVDDVLDFIPSYPDYYGYVSAAIIVFTAFVAPEVLCTDRRSGMLGLYLASPLDRTTYLLSKALGVLAVLSIVTLGPVLLVLIGRTIVGAGPDGVDGWFATFARIVVAGIVVSVLYTALSLAVSSFTSRRAVASAAIVIILVATSATVDSLISSGSSPNLHAFHLFGLPFQLVYRVYGDRWDDAGRFDDVSTGLLVGAYAGWTILLSAITWWRYQRLQITR